MALNSQSFSIPFHLTADVEAAVELWRSEDRLARLWRRDASLWTGSDEGDWLGWLDAPVQVDAAHYAAVTAESRIAAFSDVLLLGMGGSVLCPALFAQAFGHQPAFPRLRVLDSLDPAAILEVERSLDLSRTLVVVASKSGSTLESRLLMAYFLDRVAVAVGRENRGRHFVAITDPGSELEQSARDLGFRHIFYGPPDVGGRFSAFSSFGLVPLALMGVDVGRFLANTMPMVEACGSGASVPGSPGVLLGVVLSVMAGRGRDKVTLSVSEPISTLSDWLEQLLAESTGKAGRGLIPVTGEALRTPEDYGDDRLFVCLSLESDDAHEPRIAALEESGQPVVRIRIPDADAIGQELFRWEIATAVAGSGFGVHPFDQPDVEASKRATRDLMTDVGRTGALAPEKAAFADDQFRVFGSPVGGGSTTLDGWIQDFFGSIRPGDYCAILAYAAPGDGSADALEGLRAQISSTFKVATTVNYGPRYLHSSGQLHKGGPATGAFLILTSEDTKDVPVPGYGYTFGVVKQAQARGDAQVLVAAGRRVLRIQIAGDFEPGVRRLTRAVRPPTS